MLPCRMAPRAPAHPWGPLNVWLATLLRLQCFAMRFWMQRLALKLQFFEVPFDAQSYLWSQYACTFEHCVKIRQDCVILARYKALSGAWHVFQPILSSKRHCRVHISEHDNALQRCPTQILYSYFSARLRFWLRNPSALQCIICSNHDAWLVGN